MKLATVLISSISRLISRDGYPLSSARLGFFLYIFPLYEWMKRPTRKGVRCVLEKTGRDAHDFENRWSLGIHITPWGVRDRIGRRLIAQTNVERCSEWCYHEVGPNVSPSPTVSRTAVYSASCKQETMVSVSPRTVPRPQNGSQSVDVPWCDRHPHCPTTAESQRPAT